jgi:hemoglobin-like flavoprotein
MKKLINALQNSFFSGDYQKTKDSLMNEAKQNTGTTSKILAAAVCNDAEDTYNSVRRLISIWCQ